MKQIIIIASFIAIVYGMLPEKCRPPNMPPANFEDCCPLGVDIVPKDLIQTCNTAFPMPPQGPPPPAPGTLPGPPRGCCYSECILKTLKIWEDGKFNSATAKKVWGEALKSKPELKTVIDNAVDECVAQSESKKAMFDEGAKLPPIPPANQTCNMMSGFMMGCFHAQVLLNCPNFTQNPQCTALKDFAKDCGIVMPKKKN